MCTRRCLDDRVIAGTVDVRLNAAATMCNAKARVSRLAHALLIFIVADTVHERARPHLVLR